MTTPTAQQIADEMLANGKISEEDRDAIQRTSEFLAEVGPMREKRGASSNWTLEFMRRHQQVIGFSDETFDQIVDHRAESGDAEAIEWLARREG